MTRIRREWLWLFLGLSVLYIGGMYALEYFGVLTRDERHELVQDINFFLLCGAYCFHLFAMHRRG